MEQEITDLQEEIKEEKAVRIRVEKMYGDLVGQMEEREKAAYIAGMDSVAEDYELGSFHPEHHERNWKEFKEKK